MHQNFTQFTSFSTEKCKNILKSASIHVRKFSLKQHNVLVITFDLSNITRFRDHQNDGISVLSSFTLISEYQLGDGNDDRNDVEGECIAGRGRRGSRASRVEGVAGRGRRGCRGSRASRVEGVG